MGGGQNWDVLNQSARRRRESEKSRKTQRREPDPLNKANNLRSGVKANVWQRSSAVSHAEEASRGGMGQKKQMTDFNLRL